MRLHLAEGLGFEPSHNGFRDRRATATLALNMCGAPGRTRTGTGLRPRDFKSLASTYSATGAGKGVLGTGRHPWDSLSTPILRAFHGILPFSDMRLPTLGISSSTD